MPPTSGGRVSIFVFSLTMARVYAVIMSILPVMAPAISVIVSSTVMLTIASAIAADPKTARACDKQDNG
jgi:hypothetical protein